MVTTDDLDDRLERLDQGDRVRLNAGRRTGSRLTTSSTAWRVASANSLALAQKHEVVAGQLEDAGADGARPARVAWPGAPAGPRW